MAIRINVVISTFKFAVANLEHNIYKCNNFVHPTSYTTTDLLYFLKRLFRLFERVLILAVQVCILANYSTVALYTYL